ANQMSQQGTAARLERDGPLTTGVLWRRRLPCRYADTRRECCREDGQASNEARGALPPCRALGVRQGRPRPAIPTAGEGTSRDVNTPSTDSVPTSCVHWVVQRR